MGMMDERFKYLLELKYWQQKDDGFIAVIMNISRDSVRYYLTMAAGRIGVLMYE